MDKNILKFIARGVMAAVIFGILSFVLVGKIKIKTQTIINQKINAIISQKTQENANELLKNSKEIAPYLPIITDFFPRGDNIISVMSALEDAAHVTQNQQIFNFESATPIESEGGLKTVKFNVVLLGNLNTFSEYLTIVEQLPFFIKLNNISISGTDGIFNSSKMNLKGVIFVE